MGMSCFLVQTWICIIKVSCFPVRKWTCIIKVSCFFRSLLLTAVINLMSCMSELGGPSGKLFRFVSCVRARGAYVRSDLGENPGVGTFPFPFLDREVFPFPSALQGPIQLQLALSVFVYGRVTENPACLLTCSLT